MHFCLVKAQPKYSEVGVERDGGQFATRKKVPNNHEAIDKSGRLYTQDLGETALSRRPKGGDATASNML